MSSAQKDARYYVVPWLTTSEIVAVYNDIFHSEDAKDYQRALSTLRTWKIRMSSFYSVGLSATLALLEADLKALDPRYSPEDLQVWYAAAFNRFLNYAHSLTMTQCSMYGAAKELGIHTFIVDVRHLCSHSSVLPSVSTFESCSKACKKWLRLFYWDNLLKEAKDVTVGDLPAISGTEGVAKELEFLLNIYDFTSHQIWSRRKTIGEIPSGELVETFSQYARSLETESLMMIRAQLLKDLLAILDKSQGKLSTIHIFTRLLVERMPHFLADPLDESAAAECLPITVVHQNLFHMVANAGVVGEVLRKLLTTSIDESADPITKKGTGYWAGQVLKTCHAYKEIRAKQQKELSPEELQNLNWESINSKGLDKAIERAFQAQGLNRENSLIFGVSKRHFWEVKFSREFIRRHLKHTSVDTKEAHWNLIYFADPPFPVKVAQEMHDVIEAYLGPQEKIATAEKTKVSEEEVMDVEIKDLAPTDEEPYVDEDLGVWSCPDEGLNWEKCPIGSHLWHVAAAH